MRTRPLAAALRGLGLRLVSSGASTVACTGARDGAMSRIEGLSGPERRRRWSAEQKRSIVAEAFSPGASVCEVARADVVAGQIYRWRHELRAAAAGFAEARILQLLPNWREYSRFSAFQQDRGEVRTATITLGQPQRWSRR